jgi:DNA-binding response OmpR family regulator
MLHLPDAHVLIIDDDPDLQALVRVLLGRAGIQTAGAQTAVEGRQLLDKENYQLLILDLMLPDMDGLELLEELRQDAQFNDLPVLILSARVDPEIISHALEMGADSYLTKPYLPQNLSQQVMTMLTQRRRQGPFSEGGNTEEKA